MTTEAPLAATLHHIGLGSPDPERLAAWHGQVMGLRLTRRGDVTVGVGPDRRILFSNGEPRSLTRAGFAIGDGSGLEALAARLDAAEWPCARSLMSGMFKAGAIELADPDGNVLAFGVPAVDAPDALGEGLPGRLQHVVVASRNALRISQFYQDVLGFVLSDNVVDEAGELRTAFLRCSEEHHSFAVFQATSDRFDHHCYEAGDWALIRDWGDRFAGFGVPVEWGPGRHGPGNNLFLFVHDPDGNWLEISAELEVVAPDRPAGEWPHEQRTLNSWGTAPLRT